MTEALLFIGVSTAGSSIMKLWPRWAETLGLDADIVGRDIPLGAGPDAYRAVVQEMGDPRVRGALVTTHKVSVYRSARDLFAELDRLAHLCREVSCISKRDRGLVGHAKDPITAGLAMDDMLGPHHWEGSDAWALCLGAGGAGTAITVRLLTLPHPPDRIIVSDRDESQVRTLEEICGQVGPSTEVAFAVASDPSDNSSLMRSLPAGSLVVNATGMGKDTPGSPVTDDAPFPRAGVAWDLNYRGDLEFLAQARRRAAERNVAVHDGWLYFLRGWTEVIAEVFELEMTPERFGALARAAEYLRPRAR